MAGQFLTVETDTSDLRAAMARFQRVTGATVEDCVKEVARTATRQMLKFTPPAGRNVQGTAAKRALEARIEGDFANIFAPRVLRGKRAEVYPNPKGIHRQQPWKRQGTAVRKAPRNPPAFVAQSKYNALLKEKKRNVGRMAAGWIRALDYLNTGKNVPAWVRRHAPGGGRITPSGNADVFALEVENPIPYMSSQQAEALAYFGVSAGLNGLDKAAAAIIRRRAKQARLEMTP